MHTRPQAHVGGRRVLRLNTGHALQGPRERQPRPLQEELAGEEGSIQLSCGKDSLGHGTEV
jgi:hypothetical protein